MARSSVLSPHAWACALAALGLALAVSAGCGASRSEPETFSSRAAARNEFERDRERCWLQSTRGVPYTCPDGPCVVALPDRIAFETCMEQRGWSRDGLDDLVPEPD